jgi:hypothetical protein
MGHGEKGKVSGFRCQKTEDREQNSENRRTKVEGGKEFTADLFLFPTSAFRFPLL